MVSREARRGGTYTSWSRLNLQFKPDLLADYLMETQSLLFIDDAYKLTAHKAQIARKCLISGKHLTEVDGSFRGSHFGGELKV